MAAGVLCHVIIITLPAQVTDYQGTSSSHSFPGGSVSGSAYTGKLAYSSSSMSTAETVLILGTVMALAAIKF